MSNLIFKPPMNISKRDVNKKHIFLAGSIGGNASLTVLCNDWQSDMTTFFTTLDFGIFNPRRDDWDSSWVQSFDNPQFYQQVNWELDALEKAEIVLLNLEPETLSPISLLELGRFSTKKIFVICPEGFWRKGNIDIFCNRYNIPLFDNFDDFKEFFPKTIEFSPVE